jgi:hypothetical protein
MRLARVSLTWLDIEKCHLVPHARFLNCRTRAPFFDSFGLPVENACNSSPAARRSSPQRLRCGVGIGCELPWFGCGSELRGMFERLKVRGVVAGESAEPVAFVAPSFRAFSAHRS